MEDDKEIERRASEQSCVNLIDETLNCMTVKNQIPYFYAFKNLDPCLRLRGTWRKCFKLKSSRVSVEDKRKILHEVYQTEEYSPTKNIWNFRTAKEREEGWRHK